MHFLITYVDACLEAIAPSCKDLTHKENKVLMAVLRHL